MGFKNAAQRKAVWASKNEQKKGSPAKQTLGTNTAPGGSAYGGHAFHEPKKYSKEQKEQMKKDLLNPKEWVKAGKMMYDDVIKPSGTWLMDWNDDGKVHPLEVAASFIPGTAFIKGAKYLNKARKFLSPFKHCASDMMHSGGWQEMRKHNSPGTIGNKAGIKHNEKMRQEIGTFKMPHSPLNKGHEVNQDSIAASKAWKAHKAEYLKKEGGQEEYDREKGEFFYSPKHKKLRLIPTDDGEVQDRSGIEKWQLAPDRKSSMSPLNKEGKKDACYHKVKSRVKVWPSAYASGQLVQCRKAGAANWGNKSKKK